MPHYALAKFNELRQLGGMLDLLNLPPWAKTMKTR
jgi:hypothetical protein